MSVCVLMWGNVHDVPKCVRQKALLIMELHIERLVWVTINCRCNENVDCVCACVCFNVVIVSGVPKCESVLGRKHCS